MPTINQLVRKPRKARRKASGNIALAGCPQKKGICVRVFVTSPNKPNSANRPVGIVRLTSGFERSVYLPGEKLTLQEHSVVLVNGGGAQDVSGNSLSAVRGVYEFLGVEGRKQARSRYGAKKPKS